MKYAIVATLILGMIWLVKVSDAKDEDFDVFMLGVVVGGGSYICVNLLLED